MELLIMYRKSFIYSFLWAAIFLHSYAIADPNRDFQMDVAKILSETNLRAGVSILNLETGRTLSYHEHEKFPMASVYKFPIALAVFKRIDDSELSLSQKIHVSKEDSRSGGSSPLFTQHPNGNVDLTIEQLLKFMVSDSDNSACDLLLKTIGGPAQVTAILRSWHIRDISVDRSEKELKISANEPGLNQLDTASPAAMTKLYALFYSGKLLTMESREKLLTYMTDSSTPPHIGSGLPAGIEIAHKSGWCAEDKCLNDTGILAIPSSKEHLAIAIFLTGKVDAKETTKKIGKIAKAGYDVFVKSSNK